MSKYQGPPPINQELVTGPTEAQLRAENPTHYPTGTVVVPQIQVARTDWTTFRPLGATALPEDSNQRKDIPLCTGVLDYFTSALVEVAKASKAGNDQHNPGEELHWARGKSMDHANCIMRHLAERGTRDRKGIRHSAYLAWRALALLQIELEADGAPVSRASR